MREDKDKQVGALVTGGLIVLVAMYLFIGNSCKAPRQDTTSTDPTALARSALDVDPDTSGEWAPYGGKVRAYQGDDWIAIRLYNSTRVISDLVYDTDDLVPVMFERFPDTQSVFVFLVWKDHDVRGHPVLKLAYGIGFSRANAATINWETHAATDNLDNLAEYFYMRPEIRSDLYPHEAAIAQNHNYGLAVPRIPIADR